MHVHNIDFYKDLKKSSKDWTKPETLKWLAKEVEILWLFKVLNNMIKAGFFLYYDLGTLEIDFENSNN